MFDLPAYLIARMKSFGIGTVIDSGLCTYKREAEYFWYRRATHHARRIMGGTSPPSRLPRGTHGTSLCFRIPAAHHGGDCRHAEANLDGLLMFQQESMYYLTGYDTFGFCFFQCLYLGADGKLALLTRSADLRQAQHTSNIEDIRIWTDQAGAQPATQLRDMLDSLGARGKRLGIETNSYGLTHFNGKAVDATMDGFCTLVEVDRSCGSPAPR